MKTKYRLKSTYPGCDMVLGEERWEFDFDPYDYFTLFELVQVRTDEGMIIRLGDEISGKTINGLNSKLQVAYFENGEFIYFKDIPAYYSVVNWEVIEHCGPPIIETQYTTRNKIEAEAWAITNYPCLSFLDVQMLSEPTTEEKRLIMDLVQKRLNERSA